MNKLIEDIIQPENEVEKIIAKNPDFEEGALYGKARRGHPEGQVIYHIKEVLANVDKHAETEDERKALRLIAIVHDTFKHKVDRSKPKSGENHHGMIARRFAEKFIPADHDILQVIQRHDDAYNAWSKGDRDGDWTAAERRIDALIMGLIAEDILELYKAFYYCDNNTGDKSQDCYVWFIEHIK
jgi:hypothetical protein